MRGRLKKYNQSGVFYLAGTSAILLSALCISFWLAWIMLSAGNFLYPVLHDVIDIQGTIEEYAPKNIYKDRFDETTPVHRAALFREILRGVNRNGEGLETLQYMDAEGEVIGMLLRPAEITHLRDVARLLGVFQNVAYIAVALYITMLVVFRLQQRQLPKPRNLLMVTTIAVTLLVLVVFLSGAKQVFYQLHTVVFPSGHQWFFYYEESLMTLLMKAPDIFAWQAGMWIALALLVCYVLLMLSCRLLARDVREAETT